MKVIAFNGSARKNGNTAILINYVFGELETQGIETEMIQLSAQKVLRFLIYKVKNNTLSDMRL